MKRYALVVSLAMLFAAFMWSCQQQDPAPLSPEGSITLGKKPGPKPPADTYTVEYWVKGALVAKLTNAVTDRKKEVLFSEDLASEEMSSLNIGSFRASFTDPSVIFITGEEEKCEKFELLFGLPVTDNDSPEDSYDANDFYVRKYVTPEDPGLDYIFTGWFRGEDSHGYRLGISFYGKIDEGDLWLPEPGQSTTISSTLQTHPTFNPEGPNTSHVDRLSMSFTTGKGFGKNSERCLWGFHNHRWKIVITRKT